MKIAIIEHNKVTNVVVGEIDVVSKLFDEIVRETKTTGKPWIGATWDGQRFRPQPLFKSWTWNEETFDYDPPSPKPEGNYYWSESEQEWIIIAEPEPEIAPE